MKIIKIENQSKLPDETFHLRDHETMDTAVEAYKLKYYRSPRTLYVLPHGEREQYFFNVPDTVSEKE